MIKKLNLILIKQGIGINLSDLPCVETVWGAFKLRNPLFRGKMKREKEQINSKSGFKDPIAIKEQREKDSPMDGKNSPYDWRCPQYDQRSSNFINAGTHYGVGHKAPIGHEGNPQQRVATLPYGTHSTMRDDER